MLRQTEGVARGPVPATRPSWLRSQAYETLTREAEEWMFRHATVLSEGAVRRTEGEARYFGSTMISIELAESTQGPRRALDARTVERITQAAQGSVRLRLRALRLACAELPMRTSAPALRPVQTETRIWSKLGTLHIDVDLEVALAGAAVNQPKA